MSTKKLTPLMEQYFQIKSLHENTLLLFQVGDFYELFFDDAKIAAKFLGIALTARGKNNDEPIPLCGVPLHSAQQYIHKLVKGGFKVALCDQLEEAKPGTVVKRGVTQVLTPGTVVDENLLDEKTPVNLVSVFQYQNTTCLVSFELLTGIARITRMDTHDTAVITSEIARCFAHEIILVEKSTLIPVLKKLGHYVSTVSLEQINALETLGRKWISSFDQESVEKINSEYEIFYACMLLYSYLDATQKGALESCKKIYWYKPEAYLHIDVATEKNLELISNATTNKKKYTLFGVLDSAKTPMGSRTIKRWIIRPLQCKKSIEKRLSVVSGLVRNFNQLHAIRSVFSRIGDIERIIGRISLNKAPLHDYTALKNALESLPELQLLLSSDQKNTELCVLSERINNFSDLYSLLSRSIHDDATKDWIIKEGFDSKLDELRELVFNSNNKIIELELQQQKKTGINSLKIRFNSVHGYYIEITNANMHLVPQEYKRMQTLAGKERFTIPELHELQVAIYQAKNQLVTVQKDIFEQVKNEIRTYIVPLQTLSNSIASIDALCSFAFIAYERGYVEPEIVIQNRDIIINNGRHPIVEHTLEQAFIPNDTALTDAQSLWIITGPNMGGKSTYLRQVAHISIMAHIGSFVPASSAQIPLLDRIFTRIGAGDNLAEGKSTFLVEMVETATICNSATKNSLVILDEVGRGTSTFDGLAIAQAVIEYLYNQIGARCLFATHYHELTQLQKKYSAIVAYHMTSKKTDKGIIFLHTLSPGAADGSFGVEVAKLAALPQEIITRAESLVQFLTIHQKQGQNSADIDSIKQIINQNIQLKNEIKILQDKIIQYENKNEKLSMIDYDNLSPKKAFDILWNMKELQ